MQIYNIPISHDLKEITRHGSEFFPIAVYETEFSKNVLGHVPLHWHDEIQFVLVIRGSACFTVNRTKHYIHEGSGLFINSSCLHSAIEHNSSNCSYVCFDMSPNFFQEDNIIQQKYITPLINSKSISSVELNISNPCQKDIIGNLSDLYEIYTNRKLGFEIKMYALIFNMIYSLIVNISDNLSNLDQDVMEDNRIKMMLSFIHENYRNKIQLEDIAKIDNISRSECCRFFKKMVKVSPIEYLIIYRLNQSIKLLKASELNITEISYEVGYGSVSYYIEQFRKHTGLTPKEYRSCSIAKID